MFQPIKAREDLICKHCGELIPTGTYYENYNGLFHLECIWDDIYNNMYQNSYEGAREYFLSLQKHIGRWPYYGLDTEETYLSDLELVKHNNRLIGESLVVLQKCLNYLLD